MLLGANVGTAATAWIVALGLGWLSAAAHSRRRLPARARSGARSGAGSAVVGIGLMLLSLHLLSAATDPLLQSPALRAFLAMLDNAWPVALIFAAALAILAFPPVSPSWLLILSLGLRGGISTALASSCPRCQPRRGRAAGACDAGCFRRRAARNDRNVIVRQPAAPSPCRWPLLCEFMELAGLSPQKLAVDVHLLFNLAVALIAFPVSPLLYRLTAGLIPQEAESDNGHAT